MRQKEYLDRDLSELRQLMVEVEEQHGMTGMVCMCVRVSAACGGGGATGSPGLPARAATSLPDAEAEEAA